MKEGKKLEDRVGEGRGRRKRRRRKRGGEWRQWDEDTVAEGSTSYIN